MITILELMTFTALQCGITIETRGSIKKLATNLPCQAKVFDCYIKSSIYPDRRSLDNLYFCLHPPKKTGPAKEK